MRYVGIMLLQLPGLQIKQNKKTNKNKKTKTHKITDR